LDDIKIKQQPLLLVLSRTHMPIADKMPAIPASVLLHNVQNLHACKMWRLRFVRCAHQRSYSTSLSRIEIGIKPRRQALITQERNTTKDCLLSERQQLLREPAICLARITPI